MLDERVGYPEPQVSRAWPVAWSAVIVGALTALAVAVLIGLFGYAVGAHQFSERGGVDWRQIGRWSVIFSILGGFFAFVAGGWVAARLGGFRRAETAMLHGAIAWLVTLPFLMLLGALGSGSYLGGWYGGLAGTAGAVPVDPGTAAAVRNTAVATAGALLLGLAGSALGGWMASGEPMTIAHYRRRKSEDEIQERPRRAA
jgi:hypothetical protein